MGVSLRTMTPPPASRCVMEEDAHQQEYYDTLHEQLPRSEWCQGTVIHCLLNAPFGLASLR